ncbi:hypothetical protein [Myxacorys almedinensis]|uniref:hypothetical protein n=1 Tax=Myxacorys almedinensis TaxID=2651157 RepID=UPI00192EAA42|nr:hypothetical protein [Myxacorys almedinensis]
MAGLFELLDKIRVKPGMYIGGTSVTDLFMFLGGYKIAQQEFGVAFTEAEKRFYREFQPWLQRRLGMTTSRSWAKMLEFRSINQQEAFESFFKLLDEFCESEGLARREQPQTAEAMIQGERLRNANDSEQVKAS